MHEGYKDIRSRLGEPLWWDDRAVPRYDPFVPQLAASVYADEVALLLIACQGCRRTFAVAATSAWPGLRGTLLKSIREQPWCWGDPPNVECCPAGPTMNSEALAVLEYWVRDAKHDWERMREYEGLLRYTVAMRAADQGEANGAP